MRRKTRPQKLGSRRAESRPQPRQGMKPRRLSNEDLEDPPTVQAQGGDGNSGLETAMATFSVTDKAESSKQGEEAKDSRSSLPREDPADSVLAIAEVLLELRSGRVNNAEIVVEDADSDFAIAEILLELRSGRVNNAEIAVEDGPRATRRATMQPGPSVLPQPGIRTEGVAQVQGKRRKAFEKAKEVISRTFAQDQMMYEVENEESYGERCRKCGRQACRRRYDSNSMDGFW